MKKRKVHFLNFVWAYGIELVNKNNPNHKWIKIIYQIYKSGFDC